MKDNLQTLPVAVNNLPIPGATNLVLTVASVLGIEGLSVVQRPGFRVSADGLRWTDGVTAGWLGVVDLLGRALDVERSEAHWLYRELARDIYARASEAELIQPRLLMPALAHGGTSGEVPASAAGSVGLWMAQVDVGAFGGSPTAANYLSPLPTEIPAVF